MSSARVPEPSDVCRGCGEPEKPGSGWGLCQACADDYAEYLDSIHPRDCKGCDDCQPDLLGEDLWSKRGVA